MLKRKMMQTLLDWKEDRSKNCLLVKGARQTGKTYLIEQFAREQYENFIEINFVQTPALGDAFQGELTVPQMIKQLSLLIPGVQFIPGKTLLFLDEIQNCPQARTSLKFWALDKRFDVIASGSLLGVNYKEVSSYPVGYETQVELFALDFEEYLWAMGMTEADIAALKRWFDVPQQIPAAIHTKMMQYLREYMAVGGMPAVVNAYLASNNFNDVHAVQQQLLDSYLNDIAKYAPAADKPKARDCYLSVPRQLAKENTKFQYSVVSKGSTARKYANSVDWLKDAGLVQYCYNVSTPQFPLTVYVRQDLYRLYGTDIGLLIAMYGYDMKAAVVNDTLSGPAKGGIYENLIADFLIKKNLPLYYYRKDDASVEIEFLLTQQGHIAPVEVKANRGATASLNRLLESPAVLNGYKLTAQNAGVDGKKWTLPFYLAMFL
jgi:predicted AAA+ superfamily ATPase